MGFDSFRISEVLPASPALVYATWLSGIGHSEMTGASARCVPGVGGKFSAWDGYIWGVTLELDPNRRIVQSWRTLEFPGDAPDSRLEVTLEETPEGARVTLHHTRLPAGQGDNYRQGWFDHYFDPMRAYFVRLAGRPRPKAGRRKPARKAPGRRKAVRGKRRTPGKAARGKAARGKPASRKGARSGATKGRQSRKRRG